MSTLPDTFLFAIPLPVFAIGGIILCVVLKYACCCTKKAQASRRERLRASRRSRGRFDHDPDDSLSEVTIPEEQDDTPKKILVNAEHKLDDTIYQGPPCVDDAPPPYHAGTPPSTPPSYPQGDKDVSPPQYDNNSVSPDKNAVNESNDNAE